MLVITCLSDKYQVDHFPTLSELNEEIKGRLEQPSSTNDTLQPTFEVLATPSLFASHIQKSKYK